MNAGSPTVVLPERGESIDRFAITAAVSNGRHAAVLQARDDDGSYVALKLATTGVGAQLVARDEQFLRAIDADATWAPRLVVGGSFGDRRYVASSWMPGAAAHEVAAELRAEGSAAGLLDLCGRIARSFAVLHARGVVHGQVHPRHVLVDADGRVALVDLSLAATASDQPPPARLEARFGSLGAPEQAESLLRGGPVVLTPAAEQFSVGALLYLLVTGRMYARLRLERELLARDIVAARVRAFSEHGLPASPALEAVLARALQVDPARRYGSTAELAAALEALRGHAGATRRGIPPRPALAQVLATFRRDASARGAIEELAAPTCSINFGAAGVAFALTRLGTVTGDAVAFAQAERWLSAAERMSTAPDAFDDGDQLTPRTVGVVSPFHAASGVAAARACLSRATGDHVRQQAALEEFLAATAAPCPNLDLTLGRSSVLLVEALLLAGANREWPAVQRLGSLGDELCAGIWRDADGESLPYYGIAHGWAGLAYATLMWSRARDVPPPPQVRGVLELLAGVAEPWQRGAGWPVSPPGGASTDQFWPGWCHGNAGYVFLWNLAADTYGDPGFAELAGRAAWLVDRRCGVSSLCCGTAGQAYAALNQYRGSGDDRWLSLAVALAERGAAEDALAGDAPTPLSLYKGHVGLALLAAELESPDRAAMPLFEFEPAQNVGRSGPKVGVVAPGAPGRRTPYGPGNRARAGDA